MKKNLEEEVFEILAKEIQTEIDQGIMSTILVETGWTPVKFYFNDNYHANDVNLWLITNCKNQWRRFGSEYLFKDKKEAEWFILRWV